MTIERENSFYLVFLSPFINDILYTVVRILFVGFRTLLWCAQHSLIVYLMVEKNIETKKQINKIFIKWRSFLLFLCWIFFPNFLLLLLCYNKIKTRNSNEEKKKMKVFTDDIWQPTICVSLYVSINLISIGHVLIKSPWIDE